MSSAKRVLLIIGGGIAAYKSLELIRLLRKQGIAVRAILTDAGKQFVTPLSVSSLTEDKVYQDLFDLTDESEMGHIQLSRDADLLVVAPATADLMAKMAGGAANDLASTTLLATDKPILTAPAMNVRMWQHPATQRNLATLAADGVLAVGPNEGDMACGEYGPGRMAEPAEILTAVLDFFEAHNAARAPLAGLNKARPLAGCRALVTAGPTREAIDPVRYIANRSSGKQGFAIAKALAALGADTTLVSGPVDLADPVGVRTVRVEAATQMLEACKDVLPVDVGVFTAAVADWRVANEVGHKLKKAAGKLPDLKLSENPDILRTISTDKTSRPRLVIGFAAETDDVIQNATKKLAAKGCDWIVANDVAPGTGVMGGDHNRVHIVAADGVEDWRELPKADVARKLAFRIAEELTAMAQDVISLKTKKDAQIGR